MYSGILQLGRLSCLFRRLIRKDLRSPFTWPLSAVRVCNNDGRWLRGRGKWKLIRAINGSGELRNRIITLKVCRCDCCCALLLSISSRSFPLRDPVRSIKKISHGVLISSCFIPFVLCFSSFSWRNLTTAVDNNSYTADMDSIMNEIQSRRGMKFS